MGDYSYTPLYVDLLLWLIYALLIVAIGFVIWSVVHGLRQNRGQRLKDNGIPVRIIVCSTVFILSCSLLTTYLTGSTKPIISNGKAFTDAFWLRICDMFINTSIILAAIATLAVAFGMSGLSRKIKV